MTLKNVLTRSGHLNVSMGQLNQPIRSPELPEVLMAELSDLSAGVGLGESIDHREQDMGEE